MPHTARHALRRAAARRAPARLLSSPPAAPSAGWPPCPARRPPTARADAPRARCGAGARPGASPPPAAQARGRAPTRPGVAGRRSACERAGLPRPPSAAGPAAAAPAPAAAAAGAVAPPPPPPAAAAATFVRPGTGRLTSGYGSRWGRLHAGIDLAAGRRRADQRRRRRHRRSPPAPRAATAARPACSTTTAPSPLYAHMSELLVSAGQRVTAGTYLGREGSPATRPAPTCTSRSASAASPSTRRLAQGARGRPGGAVASRRSRAVSASAGKKLSIVSSASVTSTPCRSARPS